MITATGGIDLLDAHTGRTGGVWPHAVYLMLLSGLPANQMTATPTDWRNLELAVAWPEQTRFQVNTNVSAPVAAASLVQCSFPVTAVSTSPATVAPASAVTAFALCDAAFPTVPSKVWGGDWFDGPITVAVGARFQINAGGISMVAG